MVSKSVLSISRYTFFEYKHLKVSRFSRNIDMKNRQVEAF